MIVTEMEEKDIVKMYDEDKIGIYSIRKKYPYSEKTIKDVLTKYDIHIRGKHEAICARNEKGNLLNNHSYFSCESANMAWIMGFIAADGSIEKDRNVIKIGLNPKDKDVLEKIKREIQLDSEIKEFTTNQGFDVCKIQWSSKQHKDDLARYNIIPQKTFKLDPPYQLDRKYWIDYIRGFFDGDGSIYMNGSTVVFEIVSARKEILEWIVNYLYEDYGIDKVNIHETIKKEPLYLLMYSTKASLKIYEALYADKNALYLQRKKDKYTEIVQKKKV